MKPDVVGVIGGTVLAGGATLWILHDNGVIETHQLGLAAAVVLVVSGVLGLAASGRH
jgi:hypothetical protein